MAPNGKNDSTLIVQWLSVVVSSMQRCVYFCTWAGMSKFFKHKFNNKKFLFKTCNVGCVCVCVHVRAYVRTYNVVAILPWQYGWYGQLWQFQLLSRWVISLTGDRWGSDCVRAIFCACVFDMFPCTCHIMYVYVNLDYALRLGLDAWALFVTHLGDAHGGHRSFTAKK